MVRHGATWPELGAVVMVVAGVLLARWAMLGAKVRWRRPREVHGRGAG